MGFIIPAVVLSLMVLIYGQLVDNGIYSLHELV